MTTKTFYQERIPVGTRVSWLREMYRVPFANRPTDYGIVESHGDLGTVTVRREDTGTTVTGPAIGFIPVR